MQSYIDSKYFDLVRVSGADAEKFLQGQLTCDVSALSGSACCPGAVCNNKGRVIASFFLVKQDGEYYLVFVAGLGELFRQHLQKYMPFYKCSMELNPEGLSLFAAVGGEAVKNDNSGSEQQGMQLENLADDGWQLNLGRQYPLLIICRREKAQPESIATLPAGDQSALLLQLMLNRHYPFTADDSAQFTPQELGMDRKGYVSFSKGCYTGQEIVARMHYRGKVKKQLYLATIAAEAAVNPAQTQLFDAQDQLLGTCSKVIACGQTQFKALVTLPAEQDLAAKLHTETGNIVSLDAY